MNLSQLEVLVAIVDAGSLKKAAESVGLTHSAVSYSLSKLEAELGVTLLERNRQGITVTRIGEIVLDHARNILNEAEAIRQEVNQERGIATGKIRFGCVPQLPSRFLMGIIREFQQQYPNIQLVVFQGRDHEITDWLARHVVDVGMVLDPENYPQSVLLIESDVCVLVPSEHRLAQKMHITLEDLQNEPLVGTRREIEAANAVVPPSVFAHLELQYQVTDTSTVKTMVAEGMGLAVFPRMVFEDDINGVVIKPLKPQVTMRAFLAANAATPINNAFLQIVHRWATTRGLLT